ncbi:MAG: methylmalonyl Co-A mutase-associated GTPase MeaB, partial [Saprospiraceae bacterium]|nr:methylmalonyl Co-A mutase-associated GTPase MeaB [Saprospiraceae bacterium]
KESGQPVQVLTCSALQPSGMAEVWKNVVDFQQSVTASGYFEERRRQQAAFWLEESIQRQLREWFDRHPEVRTAWPEVRQKVAQGEWSSFKGAAYLLDLFKQ